jgi:hypothetical protein
MCRTDKNDCDRLARILPLTHTPLSIAASITTANRIVHIEVEENEEQKRNQSALYSSTPSSSCFSLKYPFLKSLFLLSQLLQLLESLPFGLDPLKLPPHGSNLLGKELLYDIAMK